MEDTKGDQLAFQMFDAQKIEQELGVDRKGLILVGLMSGGDYDQVRLTHFSSVREMRS